MGGGVVAEEGHHGSVAVGGGVVAEEGHHGSVGEGPVRRDLWERGVWPTHTWYHIVQQYATRIAVTSSYTLYYLHTPHSHTPTSTGHAHMPHLHREVAPHATWHLAASANETSGCPQVSHDHSPSHAPKHGSRIR